jgi:hypothetical protein
MLVLQTRTNLDEKTYRFFDVDDNSVKLMDIPIDELSQVKMKGQFKLITQEIRKEFTNFSNYKYQWFYEFKMKFRKGKLVPISEKSKQKAVFVSVNNIMRKYFGIT